MAAPFAEASTKWGKALFEAVFDDRLLHSGCSMLFKTPRPNSAPRRSAPTTRTSCPFPGRRRRHFGARYPPHPGHPGQPGDPSPTTPAWYSWTWLDPVRSSKGSRVLLIPPPGPPTSSIRLSSGGAAATAPSLLRAWTRRTPWKTSRNSSRSPSSHGVAPGRRGAGEPFPKSGVPPPLREPLAPRPPSSKIRRLAEAGERLAELLVENPKIPSCPHLNLSWTGCRRSPPAPPSPGCLPCWRPGNILLSVTGLGWSDAAAPPTAAGPGADPATWPARRQIPVAATSSSPQPSGARPHLSSTPTWPPPGPP